MKYMLTILVILITLVSCKDEIKSLDGADQITFTAIPGGKTGEVRVTNTFEFIVRTESLPSGTNSYVWDSKDYNGDLVSDGLYLAAVFLDGKIIARRALVVSRN